MIFLGAGLGGLTRFCVSDFMTSLWGSELPFATLIVNVSGCFLMGFLVSALIQRNMHSTFFGGEFLFIGFLGGYTTFSTFSIEALELLYKQLWWYATAYIGGHFIFTLLGCALGYGLGLKVKF
jgi:CrcB protein